MLSFSRHPDPEKENLSECGADEGALETKVFSLAIVKQCKKH